MTRIAKTRYLTCFLAAAVVLALIPPIAHADFRAEGYLIMNASGDSSYSKELGGGR